MLGELLGRRVRPDVYRRWESPGGPEPAASILLGAVLLAGIDLREIFDPPQLTQAIDRALRGPAS